MCCFSASHCLSWASAAYWNTHTHTVVFFFFFKQCRSNISHCKHRYSQYLEEVRMFNIDPSPGAAHSQSPESKISISFICQKTKQNHELYSWPRAFIPLQWASNGWQPLETLYIVKLWCFLAHTSEIYRLSWTETCLCCAYIISNRSKIWLAQKFKIAFKRFHSDRGGDDWWTVWPLGSV